MKARVYFCMNGVDHFCVTGKMVELNSEYVLIIGDMTNKICQYDFSDKNFEKVEIYA